MTNKLYIGILMLLLMVGSVFAYGGGGSGVFYAPTTKQVSNGNFMLHKVFQNQAHTTIDGGSPGSVVSKVDVNYSKSVSGYVDLVETNKYSGRSFNQLTIKTMMMLDSKEPFKAATIYFNTPTNGKNISVWQRLDLGLQNEVWIKLDPTFTSTTNSTATGSFTVTGTGLIMVAEE